MTSRKSTSGKFSGSFYRHGGNLTGALFQKITPVAFSQEMGTYGND